MSSADLRHDYSKGFCWFEGDGDTEKAEKGKVEEDHEVEESEEAEEQEESTKIKRKSIVSKKNHAKTQSAREKGEPARKRAKKGKMTLRVDDMIAYYIPGALAVPLNFRTGRIIQISEHGVHTECGHFLSSAKYSLAACFKVKAEAGAVLSFEARHPVADEMEGQGDIREFRLMKGKSTTHDHTFAQRVLRETVKEMNKADGELSVMMNPNVFR